MLNQKSVAEENWDYYRGETFEYWNGAIPPNDSANKQYYYKALKRIYHSYNLIEEVVTHYVNSLIGKPFHWDVDGNGAERAKTILEEWWKWQRRCSINQKLSQGKPIAEAIAQMLVRDNGLGEGSGFLRLFAPEKYRFYQNSDTPWKQYVLHCPTVGSVSVENDDDNIASKIIHQHGTNCWSYELLENGSCLIKKNEEPYGLIDLGFRMPIFELNGKCIIGKDSKQIQNAINHVLTLKDMNLKYAGFLERVLLNTAPPGSYQIGEDGRRIFVANGEELQFGMGTATRLTGLQQGNNDDFSFTNPDIKYREPVNIDNFNQSVRLDIETFYMSAGLGHLLSTGDGSVSGKSRIAAQKDYAVRLEGYSEIIESTIEDIFLAVLRLVEPALEADITVQLDLSHDLLKETVEMVTMMTDPGLISLETARKRLNIPNPENEPAKIAFERQAEIKAGETENNFVEEYDPKKTA